MFSTRCGSCRQLINMKAEEVRQAVEQTEASGEKIYVLHCPKCRKVVKIQVSQLKRGLPRGVAAENTEAPASSEE
jgi:hypothetical protein